MKVSGYYYLPRIPKTDEIETKWWFGRHLRFMKSNRRVLNMLGFQIIALLKNGSKNRVFRNVGWGVFFLHQLLNASLLSVVTTNKRVFLSYLRGVFKGYIRGKSVKAKSMDGLQ